MDFDTFKNVVERTKEEMPLLFELGHDNIPKMEEVFEFQKQHQIQLPKKYIQFLINYGGGYFGYVNIYSLDKQSPFYLSAQNKKRLDKLLFFADNECGDYYAFCIENGICNEPVVFYQHDDKRIHNTKFSDVFEYLVTIGLNQ